MRKVVGTADGRIFLAGQDGNVYEVSSVGRWTSRSCTDKPTPP